MYTRKRLDSYDRRTYYRLLSQMGVDSEPALRGKLNINYANDWFTGHNTQTNWTADEFINRAAHAMLRAGLVTQLGNQSRHWEHIHGRYFIGGKVVNPDIGIAGLAASVVPGAAKPGCVQPDQRRIERHPAFPGQRLHAGGASVAAGRGEYLRCDHQSNFVYTQPPTVMRPVFRKYANPGSDPRPVHLPLHGGDQRLAEDSPAELHEARQCGAHDSQLAFDTDLHINIHGVPWIVGAKKGLPNFNEYSVESIVQVSRRLEVNKGTLANVSSRR